MAEHLIMKSLDNDNRTIVQFSEKTLPQHARHGELVVVDGLLYIYADLDNSNHGRWFPLTNEKEIFSYVQETSTNIWNIPVEFHTDNVQVIIYNENESIYQKDFGIDLENKTLTLTFEENVIGRAHIIVNKSFDWVDRHFVVADKNFAITSDDSTNINKFYVELDTMFVEILKNGTTTFRKDVFVEGNLSINSITNVNDLIIKTSSWIQGNLDVENDLLVKGNTVIEGDLTVQGNTTTVDTTVISLTDNTITLNSNTVGSPTLSASIDVNRGDEGVLSVLKFDEVDDTVKISVKQTNDTFVEEEISSKTYVDNEIAKEVARATMVEEDLSNVYVDDMDLLNDKIVSERTRAVTVETSLTSALTNEKNRAMLEELNLKNTVNTKAPQISTYNKDEVDDIVFNATTAEEIITKLKTVDGPDSCLDADTLDGFSPPDFNQVHGLTETVVTEPTEFISTLTVEDGVVTGYTKKTLTLDDLGYIEEQDFDTITGLRGLINTLISRIETLETNL